MTAADGMPDPVETGNPAEAPDGFRRCLGEFATGVTVITAHQNGAFYGMTSNSFASVSLDPPLILWSIKRDSQSFPVFEACTHFAVNVLAQDQVELSQNFARSGPDKFDAVVWSEGQGKAPVLGNVAAVFECSAEGSYDGGDHLILLGRVHRFTRHDHSPLLFAKGRYAVSTDHPFTRSETAMPLPGGRHEDLDEQPLVQLLIRAYSVLTRQLALGRKSAEPELTLMQARLLKSVQSHPERTLEELLPELLLDFNASQNSLSALVRMGLLAVDGADRVTQTAEGEKMIAWIIEHAHATEASVLSRIPAGDLATARRVMALILSDHAGGGSNAG